MTWNWRDPSPEEASEAYLYFRDQYYYAANEKRRAAYREDACRTERQRYRSQLSNTYSEKLNLEKRLDGVTHIIKILVGQGGWLFDNVPEAIEKVQKTLRQANENFRKSIVHSDVPAADLEVAFETKTVESHESSANALAAYQAEKVWLEQEIAALHTKMSELEGKISALSKEINKYADIQYTQRSAMASYSVSMYYFQRYM